MNIMAEENDAAMAEVMKLLEAEPAPAALYIGLHLSNVFSLVFVFSLQ